MLSNSDSLSQMEFSEIEKNLQEFFEVASADWILLDELVDKGKQRSHRAVRSDQRIAISKQSTIFRYMRYLYLASFENVSYEKESMYLDDQNRGYAGIKVVANVNIAPNKVITGLSGVVSYCPESIDSMPECNFSIFFRDSSTFSLQGPLSFVNHSCRPNCKYETSKGKDGIVFIRTLTNINKGDEVTVSYGKSYFGRNKEFCMCPFTEEHQSKDIGKIFTEPTRSTRSGKIFSSVSEVDSCDGIIRGCDTFHSVHVSSSNCINECSSQLIDEPDSSQTTSDAVSPYVVTEVDWSGEHLVDNNKLLLVENNSSNCVNDYRAGDPNNALIATKTSTCSDCIIQNGNRSEEGRENMTGTKEIVHTNSSAEFVNDGGESHLNGAQNSNIDNSFSCNLTDNSQFIRSSKRNFEYCAPQDYNSARPLYKTICDFCTTLVELTIYNFLSHLRDKHRLEAEFKCFACSRLFSGFNSFVNHIKKHEEEMAEKKSTEIEIF